jgi:pyruvate/2-oxoglutarate/acetoin dehydrogenase E1 component/TPP-dependent pyruvate/acetoin dehydrogenase alpha subunit
MSKAKNILKETGLTKKEILNDYRIANESRQASILGRREVLTGKAKFGLFGDGKEIPQLAMAKAFKNGDWRSGYYRDQTFMLATGMMTLEEVFAQLYGDTDPEANPANGGRLMNNHFASRSLDDKGEWKNLMEQKNSAPDSSPTASQMPRLLGLAMASNYYKQSKAHPLFKKFSNNGNEVAFGTIGNASTAEGYFFETINAAGVTQVPMVMSIWDDGWGISVPNDKQITKNSISEILKGFQKEENTNGLDIYKADCGDYAGLTKLYKKVVDKTRKTHIPSVIHVTDCTQPLGHSTSGSHERYKSKEQLEGETKRDPILKMRNWIISSGVATADELDEIEKDAVKTAREAKKKAWKNFTNPLHKKRDEFIKMVETTSCHCASTDDIHNITDHLKKTGDPIRKDIYSAARRILWQLCDDCSVPHDSLRTKITNWLTEELADSRKRYSSHLYSQTEKSALKVKPVAPVYDEKEEYIPGREVLRDNFDYLFKTNPLVLAFGEDVGKIGGVNQTYEGLQKKYGENRIFDTGIREATIVGQGLGMAMRGLRPIAEIQYFDYLLYGLQVLSDDVATLHYRTNGGQKAPLIISTRGHRLEGIWHAGSPLSMVINSVRGMHVAVPRNMTQAAGFYNTYMESVQPVIIIEPLNGYRLRERKPLNMGEFKTPVGVPEVLIEGNDITLVTYGSCVRIAQDAMKLLSKFNVSAELIDVQTLVPFDVNGVIIESLKKTNKIIFFDEDVPGGATSYMMQKVLEDMNGYYYLDAKPETVTANAHRAAYSTDGDYFSNPNEEDVFERVYQVMHQYDPKKYPAVF